MMILPYRQHRPATASAACWPIYIRLWSAFSARDWIDLLQRYPSPEKLALLGEKKLATQLCKLAPRLGKRLAADITQALTQQTVIVPGTNAAVVVLPRLALQLITLRKQRDEVALEVDQRVLAHPLYPVLTACPESESGPQPDSSQRLPVGPSPLPHILLLMQALRR